MLEKAGKKKTFNIRVIGTQKSPSLLPPNPNTIALPPVPGQGEWAFSTFGERRGATAPFTKS
ncbi:MAG: hypothetical protein V8S24_01920 [Gordonibacter pamelaeae]